MSDIVVAEDLLKTYGSFRALNGLSLSIRQGSVFGLLGPNGAGKTTLIRSLLGFIKPSGGRASICGWDCMLQSVQVRSNVAYLPAEAKLFGMMRGSAVLEFFAAINPNGNRERALAVAKQLDLDLARRVAFMSTGMRQKLAIACVLSTRAPLLILDEPTANLDPNVRMEVLSLVRKSQNEGATVLFSSHVLSEIEDVCDTATIVLRGNVVKTFNVSDMRATHRVHGTPMTTWCDWWDATLITDSNVLSDISVLENDSAKVVIDIVGPIQKHLEWLSRMPVENMRIEPVGLRSVYESCCVSS
ncbi:MAG: ABC transporter ATP-binding protein [Planctomycetota bacterium]|nr:ABC transporter ATP-binding protein [Planctomycetota bacterium]